MPSHGLCRPVEQAPLPLAGQVSPSSLHSTWLRLLLPPARLTPVDTGPLHHPGELHTFLRRLEKVVGGSIHRNMSPPWNHCHGHLSGANPGTQMLVLTNLLSVRLKSTGSKIFSLLILGSGSILSLHLYLHGLIYFSVILHFFSRWKLYFDRHTNPIHRNGWIFPMDIPL